MGGHHAGAPRRGLKGPRGGGDRDRHGLVCGGAGPSKTSTATLASLLAGKLPSRPKKARANKKVKVPSEDDVGTDELM